MLYRLSSESVQRKDRQRRQRSVAFDSEDMVTLSHLAQREGKCGNRSNALSRRGAPVLVVDALFWEEESGWLSWRVWEEEWARKWFCWRVFGVLIYVWHSMCTWEDRESWLNLSFILS